MTKVEKMILDAYPVRLLINFSKKVVLPGEEKLSLYEISRFFFKELKNNRIFDSCAAVTYNFVMALPPTLLVLFSLIPYLPLHGVQAVILNALRLVARNEHMYESISGVIVDFMNNQRGDVLSSGVLLTLFFASNGMMGLIRSFERTHLSVYIKKSAFAQRWAAIKLTVLLLLVAMLSIVVLIIQSNALNEVLMFLFTDNIWTVRLLSILIVSMILYTSIAIIYRYGPSLRKRVKFFSPGAIVATSLCIVTSTIFFFLVDNFIHYDKVYGSIGTLMAFMVWIWLNTLVILIGYDLNVSVMMVKKNKEEDDLHEEHK